jgi:hypothetical protein
MYQVEIIGAVPGSEWDHPPWSSDDEKEMLAYALALIRSLERDPNGPKYMKLLGPGFEGAVQHISAMRPIIYLFADEPEKPTGIEAVISAR